MIDIIFISDYYLEEINGGAEKCNDALLKRLKKNHNVRQFKSSNIDVGLLNNNVDCFYIIANFFELKKEVKEFMAKNLKYVIYEHDHKYLPNNNPVFYDNFICNPKDLINVSFFKNAKKIICQSRLHSETLYKNLLTDNIVNAAGNFWDTKDIEILEANMSKEKKHEYAIFQTNNKNKGTNNAIGYCKKNNLNFISIPHMPYEKFVEAISSVNKIVFFPQWMESYNRVAVEAKILGCSIITNNLLGVASEEYFSLKGKELLEFIKKNNDVLFKKINDIIMGKDVDCNFEKKSIPKITISCTFYKGEKYIKQFLDDITKQTVFDKCELVIVNADSPENEEVIVKEYTKKYNNIKYHRLDYRASTTEAVNMIIGELSSGDYITVGNIDDRRSPYCLEMQLKHLMFANENVGLVYGDCLQTNKANETFENNTSNGSLYEHSKNNFSKENMIKCLPGPMPMWKKKLHDKFGYFSLDYRYANDWDMWLRFVNGGVKFKKIKETLGLYYFNPDGNSTSKENFNKKIKEECEIFFNNKDIFGENNFNKYVNYFSQGL